MSIIKKIKIKDKNKHRLIRIFDFPLLEYKLGEKKSLKFFPSYKQKQSFDTIVYLKVNAIKFFSLACIQNWINIVERLGYDYYIVCDKQNVKDKILTNIIFPNGNIKFIKSHKSLKQKILAKKFSDKNWFNAALAHMTTFYHSKKHNYNYFWNIDADDTAFLTDVEKITPILLQVENYAKNNNVPILSLDMWYSWARSKHWSFGITFTSNMNINWKKVFTKANKNWPQYFKDYHLDVTNIDWFFTYLKYNQNFDIQTFYVENMRFIHFCEFGGRRKDAGLCYWENNFIHYPLYEYVLKDKNIEKMEIPKDTIKFNSDTNEEECLNFYKTYIRGKK